MFYITAYFYTLILSILFPLFAVATEKYDLSEDVALSYGLSFSNALQIDESPFPVQNTPDQGLDNQPTSAMARFPKYLSLHGALDLKNWASLHVRGDYLWNAPLNLGLYQKAGPIHQVLLRDAYIKIPMRKYGLNVWAGIRTFEFTPVTLFGMANPFDQVGLQGAGLEAGNVQISAAVSQGTVKTISANYDYVVPDANNNKITVEHQQLILDENGNPVLYSIKEYIATVFLSGRFLLAEGRLFEPIFAFRYYFGGQNKVPQPMSAHIYKAKATSGLIVGGIFSRPISNGIAGATTVWFSSLPGDAPATTDISHGYGGSGREGLNTPMNTIGIIDSSEFYFMSESALFTAIYLTNNTYSSNLPVLKVAGDGNSLQPDSNNTSNSNNRLSIGLQPVFFINKYLVGGADLNLNYVSEKLFYDDANAIIFSPLLKWVFDGKLNSNQYLFTSSSYGLYDWK
ncbi:MAG: hypothetical protein V4591_10830, partial [Bdellovibrionota bacterium]